jgi:hypothetical protein
MEPYKEKQKQNPRNEYNIFLKILGEKQNGIGL